MHDSKGNTIFAEKFAMKYPIGIQDFGEIRRGGYVYVDKTPQMWKMISEGKYYFWN